ncbi:MAG: glycosyltransferase family 39 protein [Candidatus Levyibacteriota bacterium]
MKKFFKKKHVHLYVLFLILLGAAILRFYNVPYRYGMGVETIRDAVIGIEGARQLQFPLVGSFSSLGPFTFGPWYAYQLILATIILPFVYTPWIYLGVISVLYVFIMYKIGYLLGGKVFGLVLAFISAISPAQVISATHLTSHNNTNLFAALSIWIFLKLLSKNISYWWGFALGIVIGVGMNLHFQMAGLLILPLIVLFYKRKKYLYFLTSAAGVIVAFVPLLFFELNNNWFNTRNIFYYVTEGKNAIYVPNRWLFYVRDFWPSFWSDALGTPVWVANVIIAVLIAALAWTFYKKKLSLPMVFIIVAFVFNFILLRYYWGPRYFGYLNFLRPFVFIFTTFTILHLGRIKIRAYAAVFALLILTFFAIPKVMPELGKDPFTMSMYSAIDDLERAYPNENFVLYTCSLTIQTARERETYSLLFILDLKHKFNKEGMKIGLSSDCEFPSGVDLGSKEISPIGLYNFSDASEKSLIDKGWKYVTFGQIYDSHTKWWIREQF